MGEQSMTKRLESDGTQWIADKSQNLFRRWAARKFAWKRLNIAIHLLPMVSRVRCMKQWLMT
jgi:hypothetical protein